MDYFYAKFHSFEQKEWKSKLSVLLVFFLLPVVISAQAHLCDLSFSGGGDSLEMFTTGTTLCGNPSSNDFTNKYNTLEYWLDLENIPTKRLRIALHVFNRDDGTGGYEEGNQDHYQFLHHDLPDWVNYPFTSVTQPSDSIPNATNAPASDSKIRIEVTDVYYYSNSTLFNTSSASALLTFLETNHPERLSSLPVFYTNGTLSGHPTASAHANYRGNLNGNDLNLSGHSWVVMLNSDAVANSGNEWVRAGVVAHEIGHCLGLHHTYAGGGIGSPAFSNPNLIDEVWFEDVFGLPYNGNAPHIASFNPSAFDDPHDLITSNFMSGNKDAGYMSPRQIARLHRNLSFQRVRDYVKPDIFTSTPIEISSNETWDFDIRVYRSIVVKSGNTLTITCRVKFPEPARIIVEPGARLVVDGGILTHVEEGTFWHGIEVHGDKNEPQNPANQGIVELKNNATIEYAHQITMFKNAGGQDLNTTGSYILASNTTFYNCRRVCEFREYYNSSPSGGFEIDNLSYFRQCDIIQDDNYPFQSQPLGITMHRVNGVKIQGCNFQNDITSPGYWGDAIVSISASYKVEEYCLDMFCWSTVPTTIKGYRYGIHSQRTNRPDRTIEVNQAVFEDNFYAAFFYEHDNLVFTQNEIEIPDYFELGGGMVAIFPYGLYVSNSTGFHIEENHIDFAGSNPNQFPHPVGMVINNSGTASNKVYRNTFEKMSLGFQALGLNAEILIGGLQIRCNNFNNGRYDVVVPPQDSVLNRIGFLQGFYSSDLSNPSENKDLAGNIFSHGSSSSGYWDIENSGRVINYFHHDPSSNSRVLPRTNHSYGVGNVSGNFPYNESVSCPSEISGGIIVPLSMEMDGELRLLNEAKTLYKEQIDGGNTDELINEVRNTSTTNKQKLYHRLMELSPYLSDQTLKILIQQPVFSEMELHDILLKNPQLNRNPELVQELENRSPAMPNSMLEEIQEEQIEPNERSQLEARISNQSLKVHGLASQLIRAYGREEAQQGKGAATATDSLLALYDKVDHPDYYLQKALLLHHIGQNGAEDALLAAIEHENADRAIYEAYADVYTILFSQHSSDSLNAEQEAELKTIYQQQLPGASLLAHNILLEAGKTTPILYDVIYMPDDRVQPKSQAQKIKPKTKDRFSVYPNPASDHLYITYPRNLADAMLVYELLDINGRLLLNGRFIAERDGNERIQLPDLANGVYLIRLLQDDQILETEKIRLIRQ